jgi:hypothetical protein
MKPLEQPYIVDLTKLTIVHHFIVQNYKNPVIRIFVYNYLHMGRF